MMIEGAQPPLERAQQQAKSAHFFIWGALLTLVLTTLTDVIAPLLHGVQDNEVTSVGGGLHILLLGLIAGAPNFLIVVAMVRLGAAFGAYRRGDFFSRRSAKALFEAGLWADAAFLMKVVGAPTLMAWATQTSRAVVFDFERFDFGILALAMALTLIGLVLEAAAAIKADSDQIV